MSLRLGFWNVENLFIDLSKATTLKPDIQKLSENQWQALRLSTTPNKPLQKCCDLAATIRQVDWDLLMLCEVGGPHSLEAFNRLFLSDLDYRAQVFPSNSLRGIDLAILHKPDLELKTISHRHRPLANQKKFARDCLEISIQRQQKILCQGLLVHLKSHYRQSDADPWGLDQRRHEVQALIELYRQNLQGSPAFLCGDFNGSAQVEDLSQEFLPLRTTDLSDFLKLKNTPLPERCTHLHFTSRQQVRAHQLDYFFLNPQLQSHFIPQSSGIHHYQSTQGLPFPLPRNRAEKSLLPSDHYPLLLNFDL